MKITTKGKLERQIKRYRLQFEEGKPTAQAFCDSVRKYYNKYGETDFIFDQAQQYDLELRRRSR